MDKIKYLEKLDQEFKDASLKVESMIKEISPNTDIVTKVGSSPSLSVSQGADK